MRTPKRAAVQHSTPCCINATEDLGVLIIQLLDPDKFPAAESTQDFHSFSQIEIGLTFALFGSPSCYGAGAPQSVTPPPQQSRSHMSEMNFNKEDTPIAKDTNPIRFSGRPRYNNGMGILSDGMSHEFLSEPSRRPRDRLYFAPLLAPPARRPRP